MGEVCVDLKSFLTTLGDRAGETLENSDFSVEERGDSFSAGDIPSSSSDTWIKLPEVVAVVCDLKGSTRLGTGKYDKSTARIYQSGVEGAVSVLHEFGANFIDIQGDGGFGIFWGDRAYERALCAAITIRTFSVGFAQRLERKWPDGPPTGYKVGMHAGRTLVKRIGTRRVVSEQEAVWAGKVVNYAAKCAQSADRHQVVVTGAIWAKFENNDYVAFSCDCDGGARASLWKDKEVESLPEGERDALMVESGWCDTCGPEFCAKILSGEKKRCILEAERTAIGKLKMAKALEAKRARDLQRRASLSSLR
ncbi:hypothetical protein ABYF32_00945 [Buchananella felis]|uniref:hypothetical protein n=1 Tax=Buchananella felis TaxID=3231492 RepID=UPI00352880DD